MYIFTPPPFTLFFFNVLFVSLSLALSLARVLSLARSLASTRALSLFQPAETEDR